MVRGSAPRARTGDLKELGSPALVAMATEKQAPGCCRGAKLGGKIQASGARWDSGTLPQEQQVWSASTSFALRCKTGPRRDWRNRANWDGVSALNSVNSVQKRAANELVYPTPNPFGGIVSETLGAFFLAWPWSRGLEAGSQTGRAGTRTTRRTAIRSRHSSLSNLDANGPTRAG